MTDTSFDDVSPTFWNELNSCCDRFEAACKSGDTPPIEDYLKNVSSTLRPFYLRELVRLEVYYRRKAGERIIMEEYADRFHEYPNISTIIGDALTQTPIQDSAMETEFESTQPFGTSHLSRPVRHAKDDNIGRVVGNYRLIECIGRGGMGAVYRASHMLIDCERALKLLSPTLAGSPEAFQRFLVEAQATVGTLTHPNVVTTFDVNRDGDFVYLVMELLDGSNLAEIVNRDGPLAPERAAQIIEDAAKGLEAAHRRGLVHLHIKPHNIMLTTDDVTKLLDLGLVRIVDAAEPAELPSAGRHADRFDQTVRQLHTRLTEADAVMGTLAYMAPEQARFPRHANARSDIYSLGCTLYFLLTGKHPFVADTPEAILYNKLNSVFPQPSEICVGLDESLQEIVLKMMSFDPWERYESADRVAQTLRAWQKQTRLLKLDSSTDSIPIETRSDLKDVLLRLDLVSKNDWQIAEARCEQRNPQTLADLTGSEHGFRGLTIDQGESTFVMPSHFSPNDPLPILDELRTLSQASDDGVSGLSEFQVGQIIRGNADLLRIKDYVVLNRVGHGWKGEVFKARKTGTNQLVAVRTFSAEALKGIGQSFQALDRFIKLAVFANDGPDAILPPLVGRGSFDSRAAGPVAYLVTPYFPGHPLKEFAQRQHAERAHDRIAWALNVIADIGDGLQSAHDVGILHLDIHDRSIWVTDSGNCKLLDAGIAQLLIPHPSPFQPAHLSSDASAPNPKSEPELDANKVVRQADIDLSLIGTPNVMPPEQWRNRANYSKAVDIYNLGCVLFYLLFGHYPFASNDLAEIVNGHLSESPFRRAESQQIPAMIRPVIEKALAKLPEDRYASVAEFAAELRRVADDGGFH